MESNNEITKVEDTTLAKPLSSYSPEEIKEYEKITSGLVETDNNSILNYGSDIRNVAEAAADELLKATRRGDAGDVGDQLGELLSKLGSVKLEDPGRIHGWKKAICKYLPMLKPLMDDFQKFISRYDTVSETFEKIKDQVDKIKIETMEGNNSLGMMYKSTQEYREKMMKLVKAGEYKLAKIDEQLRNLDQTSVEAQRLSAFRSSLERDIQTKKTLYYSLENTMGLIIIMAKDCQMVCQKAERISTVVIPDMKNQANVAIRALKLRYYSSAFDGIDKTADSLMRQTTQNVHDVSIQLTKQTIEEDIKYDSLIEVMKTTSSTVDEMNRLFKEGNKQAREKLEALEQESLKLKKSIVNTENVVEDRKLFNKDGSTVVPKELQ